MVLSTAAVAVVAGISLCLCAAVSGVAATLLPLSHTATGGGDVMGEAMGAATDAAAAGAYALGGRRASVVVSVTAAGDGPGVDGLSIQAGLAGAELAAAVVTAAAGAAGALWTRVGSATSAGTGLELAGSASRSSSR